MRATRSGLVTLVASPSRTRSASRTDTAIEQRGSRAILRLLRVREPVWHQKVPSSQMAPTAVRCALLSLLRVASPVVCALCASGAGADRVSSFSVTSDQWTGGSPSASPRFTISIDFSLSCRVHPHNDASWIQTFRHRKNHRWSCSQAFGQGGAADSLPALRGDDSRLPISEHRRILARRVEQVRGFQVRGRYAKRAAPEGRSSSATDQLTGGMALWPACT